MSSHQEVNSGLDVSTALAGNTPQKGVPKPLTPSEQQEANRIVAAAQARYAAEYPASYAKAKAAFDEMLKAHNTASGAGSGTAVGPGAVIHRADFICVPVYKWELESIAWFVIIVGGATAAVGGFIDATIVGLPVGAVLNAVGIGTGLSGSALLWWADTYYEDGSATVCFWS